MYNLIIMNRYKNMLTYKILKKIIDLLFKFEEDISV